MRFTCLSRKLKSRADRVTILFHLPSNTQKMAILRWETIGTPLPLPVGMGLGSPDAEEATGCAFFAEDQSVKVLERFSSPSQLAGSYCICIFDVGNIFPGESVGYELAVQHPK